MDWNARATIVALLIGAIVLAGTATPALARVSGPAPRVALIVGPAGAVTERYRALAERAAKSAERAGAEVLRVYSPDATWPAVKAATRGASIVVYLGHGNGWPSRYRDDLYPPTQNGFGLNPVAGVDDSAHQYFGEAFVEDLDLAPNAVVLLHHLCYASGNTEPGLPEGSEADAIARVDNFAAGFVRAGAAAVVAEAHLGPAYYVRELLRGSRSIDRIWNRSPTAHGHTFAVASVRSTGYALRLDPERTGGGYYRSLVTRGVTAGDVRGGAQGSPSIARSGAAAVGARGTAPVQPSLSTLGLTFRAPVLRSAPIAETPGRLALPLEGSGARRWPAGAQVGLRWDPILLDPPLTPIDGTASATPAEPPPVELVVPERLGAVVTVGPASRAGKAVVIDTAYPSEPGLYRLAITLHDPAGVAYDAASQALVSSLLVRVAGPFAAAIAAPASLTLEAGTGVTVPVNVLNAGAKRWDAVTATPPDEPEALLTWLRTSRAPAVLVGTWVSADGHQVPVAVSAALDPDATAPGGSTAVGLALEAPNAAGDYLLLLDVVSPELGPLSALGSQPAIVRVRVAASVARKIGQVPGEVWSP